MKEIGPKLGDDVKLVEIKNGMHDLFLSNKESRENVFSAMFEWLRRN
jgi:alpha-beta hydrolase superfamily lysophospholipase